MKLFPVILAFSFSSLGFAAEGFVGAQFSCTEKGDASVEVVRGRFVSEDEVVLRVEDGDERTVSYSYKPLEDTENGSSFYISLASDSKDALLLNFDGEGSVLGGGEGRMLLDGEKYRLVCSEEPAESVR